MVNMSKRWYTLRKEVAGVDDEHNPFSPSYGVSPPLLVGRDAMLEEFERGLREGPGALERSTCVTGARGTGKTVMLNAFEEIARNRGWHVINESGNRGISERVGTARLPALLHSLDPDKSSTRLKSVGGFGASVSWDSTERHPVQLDIRGRLELVIGLIQDSDPQAGLLITIDEIPLTEYDELRGFGNAIQLVRRTNLNIALAVAGLPHAVSEMLNQDVLTFLRRGKRYTVESVEQIEASYAISEPLRHTGREITTDALSHAAAVSRGYPFLIQLVGSQIWRHTPRGRTANLDTARRAGDLAIPDMRRLVHMPALNDLSALDRAYLAAVAIDDGPARQRDIAERMGVDNNTASTYRIRLIAAEVIQPAGHGHVDFDIPYMRDTIRALNYPMRHDTKDAPRRKQAPGLGP